MIFGLFNSTSVFVSFKNTAGNIIAGNTAEGTKLKIIFVLSLNFSGLINKTELNLVK